MIRNLPNRRAVWHFGECEYYCRGCSECEQRHVFDTYVRDCVSARIRHDVQERAITRYCRWIAGTVNMRYLEFLVVLRCAHLHWR